MRTILLPIYNGLRARNFFLTDLYPELLKRGARLIILVPSLKLEYYQKTYANALEHGLESVHPERGGAPLWGLSQADEPRVSAGLVSPDSDPKEGRLTKRRVSRHALVEFVAWDPAPEHWLGRSIQWVAFNALGTGTVRAKQYAFYVRDGDVVKFILRRAIGFLFGGSRLFRRLLRVLDRLFVPADRELLKLIARHKPACVLAPDIILTSDRLVLRAARAAGIKTIGMVRSWDNLTAKGVIQVMPDWLIAQTDTMKKEAVALGEMKPERVRVCGVAQFDEYWKPPTKTREEFFNSLGIPHDRRVILCAPFFGEYSQSSGIQLIKELANAIDYGPLPKDTHLLVRYRPEDLTADNAPDTQAFDHPRITVTKPYSVPFCTSRGKPDYEFTKSDVDLMVNSLRWSAVVITTISTLTVDAIALDRPVVNIRYDADPETPDANRVELFSHFDHYLALEKTGGVRLAHSFDELTNHLNAYLANPLLDSEGRAEIRRAQIQFEDARSGKRSAEAILGLLQS